MKVTLMSASLSRFLRLFLQRQDGAMVIIGLFLFVGMIFTASLALDMARYEQERARVQGVADRAVLAAANIRRDGDGAVTSEDFLRGYFLAEGFTPEQMDQWTIITGDGVTERSVTVAPRASMGTMLMTLIGVDDLPLAAPARAEVRAGTALEVVMVLDISGSMSAPTSNGLTRLQNLQVAATEMVGDLLEDREPGDVAITIVPYESWVVPSPTMLDFMTIDAPQTSGVQRGWHCYELMDWQVLRDEYLDPAPTNVRGNGNPRANSVRNSRGRPLARRDCGTMYGFRVVRPLLTNEADLVGVINSLQPLGTTSIDLGVASGAMFFDSDLRPYVNSMIDANQIHQRLRDRPAGIDTPGVVRVMVVMTDGENCCHGRPLPNGNVDRFQMDDNTRAVCNNLRRDGVLVFAVAFEAPERGRDLMRDCASSDGHFFNTNGAGLSDAFRAIGRQINAQSLRLTH
jgi:hypothetical protein